MVPVAGRGFSLEFTEELRRLAHAPDGLWLRDILLHPDLVLAVRRDALAVYHRGASIFLAEFANGRIAPKTHVKYLQRSAQAYAALNDDGTFSLDPIKAIWTRYEGTQTLADMLRAAASLAGPEKIGLHALLKNSPHVVNTEIVLEGESVKEPSAAAASPASRSVPAVIPPQPSGWNDPAEKRAEISAAIEVADSEATVPSTAMDTEVSEYNGLSPEASSSASSGTPSSPPRLDRLDVATLEERDGAIQLVFHEAKHFANKELRAASNKTPPVLEQIERYEATLRRHEKRLLTEYGAVCRALVELAMLRHEVQQDGINDLASATPPPLDPLVQRVAEGEALTLDLLPRLVIFGFDEDQKSGAVWKRHRDRLEAALGSRRLYAVGNTRTKTSAAFR
ncbi:hypothetical protein [Aureimonas psammosilenae]|uniref:hypothetical protein n=1 Tax=Aureimonas psammosilenae TaxID=2495496 RepID=UPI0012609488|nr:hypothetical protein [Aureimonas psammosilenae]